ncbi:hypothetical protein GCM10029992_24520 [Glycomyces albus]
MVPDDYERVSVDTDTDTWVQNADQAIGIPGVNIVGGVMSAPGLGHVNNIGSGIWDMASGEADLQAGMVSILASVTDLGLQAAGLASDPLGTLVGWGLDILIGLVQPLEELIHMVSGDPGAMRNTATIWGRVAEAEVKLSQALVDTLEPMADWTTADGLKCRGMIDDLAASIFQLAKTGNGLQTVLQTAQALAELIKGAIKWLLSQLIKYFIMVVAPQLAASIATFGATAASAIGLAVAETATTTIQATRFTTRIMQAFSELAQAFRGFARNALPGMVIGSLQGSGASLPDGPGSTGGGSDTAGSGNGGTIDPDVIEEVAPTLAKIAEDASGVAEVVDTTASDELTWGICGLAEWVTEYEEKAAELKEHTNTASQTLNTFSSQVTGAAQDWRTTDEDLASAFSGLESDLEAAGE